MIILPNNILPDKIGVSFLSKACLLLVSQIRKNVYSCSIHPRNKLRGIFEQPYNRKKFYLIISLVFALGIVFDTWFVVSFLSRSKQGPKLLEVSSTQSNTKAPQKSIVYYITASQELLNKARTLSSNQNQTEKDKGEILATVKSSLETINEGISYYPRDDRTYVQRASVYEAIVPFIPQAMNLAIRDLKTATDINSQNPQYFLRLADLASKQSDFSNAAVSFYNAYVLDPTNVQTIYRLAETLERNNQLIKANYYYEKVVSLLPQTDENRKTIKAKQRQLEALMTKDKLKYISDPTSTDMKVVTETGINPNATPDPKITPLEIIETQDLPIEQAAIKGDVIIAAPNETEVGTQENNLDMNAKKGQTVLPAGSKEVIVTTTFMKDNSNVRISPLSSTQNHILYIKSKSAGQFVIGIDSPLNTNIKVEWWIID